jgi:hypothetical protein
LWFWGEGSGLDRVLYFDGEIFHSCEWNSFGFFFLIFLFNSSQGIWLGDSLLPLLFVMVMEAFSWMLTAMMEQGLFTGLSVG